VKGSEDIFSGVNGKLNDISLTVLNIRPCLSGLAINNNLKQRER
jgi:hypothetical protein